MSKGWNYLAHHMSKALQYMKAYLDPETKVTIIVRLELPNGESQQLIGSEYPHAEIAGMLRKIADKHETPADYTAAGIVPKMKPKAMGEA